MRHLFVLAALSSSIAASDASLAQLRSDDECSGQTEECALSALQVRAQKDTNVANVVKAATASEGSTNASEELNSSVATFAKESAAWDPFLFPSRPPVQLAAYGMSMPGTLTGGPVTRSLMGMRVQRYAQSVTGRDMALFDVYGNVLYATEGEFWTMHHRTRFFSPGTNDRIAVVSKSLLSLHTSFEIESYTPICPGQKSSNSDQGDYLYPYARLTKDLLTVYTYWRLERYNCGGGLTEQWYVKSRNWISVTPQYNVEERASRITVGTIDGSHWMQATPNYDLWLTAGEDMNLFGVMAVILDIDAMLREKKQEYSLMGANSSMNASAQKLDETNSSMVKQAVLKSS